MWKKIANKIDLLVLMGIASFLNIFKIWELGYGNSYYAAAIKSMQSNFSNFFFLSLDSTGFISIDKSPLSLWVDAVSAKVFGFSGMAILLPHAVEGILVTVLTYVIVKRVGGRLAALIAGLLITLSPVNVAVYRNNTPDALLLVFILLTIFFVLKYFDSKKLKFLLVAGVMLGLGFNTKMLQAYLILPAICATILAFSPGRVWQRIKPLAVFLIITLIVSFSWITIVDLTPADMRPYVGSSENNSAWNLAFGYNGVQRFEGESSVGGNPGFNVGETGLTRLFIGEMGTQTGWFLASALLFSAYFLVRNYKQLLERFVGKDVKLTGYQILTVINIVFLATGYVFFSYASFFHSYYLNIFAVPIAFLIGSLFYELREGNFKNKILLGIIFASLLIQGLLINQAGYATYLIPIILIAGGLGVAILLATQLKQFGERINFKTALYGGLGCMVFALFATPLVWSSYTTNAANTATAIFIGGPSVGGGFDPDGSTRTPNGNFGDGGNGNDRSLQGMNPPAFQADGDGNQFADGQPGQLRQPRQFGQLAQPPADGGATGTLPGTQGQGPQGSQGGLFGGEEVDEELLNYLKQNYADEKYFVAVQSSQSATGFILEENIGNIMVLGGFSGRDKAISLEDLQAKIAEGEIRFFYFGGSGVNDNYRGGFGRMDRNQLLSDNTDGQNGDQSPISGTGGQGVGMFNGNQDITNWVQQTCSVIESISGLYDCKGTV